MKTPVCPKCGTVKVWTIDKKRKRCGRSGCEYEGPPPAFRTGGPDTGKSRHCNDHWRDPVAMSMDGYEE